MTWIRRGIVAAIFTALAITSGCSKPNETQNPESDPGAATAAQTETEAQPAATAGDGAMKAMDATLRDAKGAEVALASAWQNGPAVVIFYRGHW